MRKLKSFRILIVVAGLILVTVSIYSYFIFINNSNIKGKINQVNSYKIKPGMHVGEALLIMGRAHHKRVHDDMLIYSYKAPATASDNVYLGIGPDSLVRYVSHGE